MIIVIILWVTAPFEFIREQPWIVVVYILMLYLSIQSVAYKKYSEDLEREITFEQLVAEIDALRQPRPTLGLRVKCWHPNKTLETYNETTDFPYPYDCEDLTRFDIGGFAQEDLVPTDMGLEHVRVEIPQFLCMNSTMLENYDRLRGELYEQNKQRDMHCDINTTWPRDQERLLVLKKDGLLRSPVVYWICSILCLNLPYLVFSELKTGNMVLPIRMKVTRTSLALT